MTDNTKILLVLDPIAFVSALIGAPLLVTLFTFYLYIPVVALVFGTPVYLVVGTPILLWMVTRVPPQGEIYALAGFATNAALLLIGFVGLQLGWVSRELAVIPVAGLVFAPAWAGCFPTIYRKCYRAA